MSILKRGAFIVLEGIDRTGKTTQAKLLTEHLNKSNIPAIFMRFPDRSTPLGSILNGYLAKGEKLDDHAVHLVFSANRWEFKDTILKHLSQGTSIICDRYAYSGVAFTAAKGLEIEWCKNPDRGLPQPDLVLYLDLSIEDAMKRGDYGNEIYEKEDFQRIVKKIYENELFDESYWKRVPANQTPENVQNDLVNIAVDSIQKLSTKEDPLPLWKKDF